MTRFNTIFPIILLLLPSIGYGQDFNTPEEAFKTLLISIETENIDLYKTCWDPEMLDKEGMFSKLNDDPANWDELKEIFTGPQEIDDENYIDNDDGYFYRGHVIAPEASGGGIGSFTMKKLNGLWKMYRW